MTRRMRRNHDQRLRARDRTFNQRVVRQHAARIVDAILNPSDYVSPRGIERVQRIAKRRETPARMRWHRSFNATGAVCRERCDLCFATGFLEGLSGEFGGVKASEKIALGLDRVFHAIEDGPAARNGLERSHGIIHARDCCTQRIAPRLQRAQNLDLLRLIHADLAFMP